MRSGSSTKPLLVAAVALLAACGSGASASHAPTGSTTSTSGTVASSGSTSSTTTPSTSTTGSRSSQSSTSTTAGDISSVGTGVVSAKDQALDLGPPSATAHPVPVGAACATLADTGWRSKCVQADTGTAKMTGVIETKSGSDGSRLWQASVWVQKGSNLVETLHGGSQDDAFFWEWINIVTSDVLGTGHRELVFGFENSGTGEILDIDAVSADGSAVLGDEEISIYKGSATVSGNQVVTYHPIYRDGDANCCPSGGDGTDTVVFRSGHWVVTASGKATPPSENQPFPDDFPDPNL